MALDQPEVEKSAEQTKCVADDDTDSPPPSDDDCRP